MYKWWVRLSRQSTPSEISGTYEEIKLWGAKPVSTGSLTELDYAFTSVINPTRLMNKLKPAGVVTNWGFFSTTQITKPKKDRALENDTDKAETFNKLKKRFGTNLGGKS